MIGSLPFGDTLDTTEATLDADDAALGALCGVDPTLTFSNSVWYAYTPAADQTLLVDTGGSSYSVAGAIATRTSGEFGAVPGGCFLGGTVVELMAGTTYYIDLLRVGEGTGGTLQLAISEVMTPDVALNVDASGRFSKAGTATLTGTVSCSAGASAFLSATLTQSVGRIATISGSSEPFPGEIVCDGTAQPWSITVTPFSGLFRGGRATASVSVGACDPITFLCGFDEVTREIRLRGA